MKTLFNIKPILQKHKVIYQRLQRKGAEEFSRKEMVTLTSLPVLKVLNILYLHYQLIHLLMVLEQCLNITAISKLRTFIHGASWMITIRMH